MHYGENGCMFVCSLNSFFEETIQHMPVQIVLVLG